VAVWKDRGLVDEWVPGVTYHPGDLVIPGSPDFDVYTTSDEGDSDVLPPTWQPDGTPFPDGPLMWHAVDRWTAGSYAPEDVVQPTIANANGHTYVNRAPEDTDVTEPTWPTDLTYVADGAPAEGRMLADVYRIVAPGDSIEYLTTLSEGVNVPELSFRVELNGTGSGKLVVNRHDPAVVAGVFRKGNLVKVRMPEVSPLPVFSWFMSTGPLTLAAVEEEAGELLTIGGRGGLTYWNNAIWLSEAFTLPWWPDDCDDPEVGAKGIVTLAPRRYRFYTVDEGATPPVIDGPDRNGGAWVHGHYTVPVCLSFDKRGTYKWPAANSKRFLVRLMNGSFAGLYFSPHQDGVTEYLKSKITPGHSQSILLGEVLGDIAPMPGAVLSYLYDEGTSPDRPVQPIPLMTVDFGSSSDSNGDPWNESEALRALSASMHDEYGTTIGQLVGTGVLDVVMGPDLDMHAYNSFGRNLGGGLFEAGVVRFVKGVNIAESLTRELSGGTEATFAEVRGNDDTYARVELPDAASRVAREIGVAGNSTDEAALEAVGLTALNLRLARGESLSFRITPGSDETLGRYLPGPEGTAGHFWIGDTVILHSGTEDPDYNDAEVRITAISVAVANGDPNLIVVPEVRAGAFASVGSLGDDSPEAGAIGDCGCPCDLGEPYPLIEDT
jgi:hypothetical protein